MLTTRCRESELAEVNQLNRRDRARPICTIQFGSGPAKSSDNFLVELAKQTGGQYGYVDTTQAVRNAAKSRPPASPTIVPLPGPRTL